MDSNTRTLLLVGGGVLLVLHLINRATDFNEGTPYEGFGVVGTAGNVADRASGGLLSRLGRAIGDFLDPVNRKSLDELTGTDEG